MQVASLLGDGCELPGSALPALVRLVERRPDGTMSVKGARPWRASRSDGEAALDPHPPARQRLGKRTRASPDRLRPERPDARSHLLIGREKRRRLNP